MRFSRQSVAHPQLTMKRTHTHTHTYTHAHTYMDTHTHTHMKKLVSHDHIMPAYNGDCMIDLYKIVNSSVDSSLNQLLCYYAFSCSAVLASMQSLDLPDDAGVPLLTFFSSSYRCCQSNTAFTLPLETGPERYRAKNCTVLAAYRHRLHYNH